MMAEIKVLRGPREISPYIPDIARLRIEVFREWPYIYDGTPEEEAKYLAHLAHSPDACVGLATINGEIVGATTAEPMKDTHSDFRAPFEASGVSPFKVFYFGESVLRADCRGMGIGHKFFDLREEAAADWGASMTAFCAVTRPTDHPLRPFDYRPLDRFWSGRGYTRRDELVCDFAWKDVDSPQETRKPLVFWTRELN